MSKNHKSAEARGNPFNFHSVEKRGNLFKLPQCWESCPWHISVCNSFSSTSCVIGEQPVSNIQTQIFMLSVYKALSCLFLLNPEWLCEYLLFLPRQNQTRGWLLCWLTSRQIWKSWLLRRIDFRTVKEMLWSVLSLMLQNETFVCGVDELKK